MAEEKDNPSLPDEFFQVRDGKVYRFWREGGVLYEEDPTICVATPEEKMTRLAETESSGAYWRQEYLKLSREVERQVKEMPARS